MKSLKMLMATAVLTLCAVGLAHAVVPQTIVLDGTNDFDPSNLVDNDSLDTQALCGTDRPLDLGRVFLTNDATYLYFGMEYRRFCFGDINLGLAIDVNGAAGGTTDPFGRKIGWNSVANKPDFIVYDVIPTNTSPFNYEVLYHDNGVGGWTAVHDGSNGLGIADADGGSFVEGRILLSDLGVTTGATIRAEWWVTQEGATKGPLDAACSDNVQMSRASQTTYDTTDVVQMTCMLAYTIQNSVDNLAPVVERATAVNFPLLANKQFNTATNKIDVIFSEPVTAATANVSTNYTVTGAASPLVINATRDAGLTNVVHLTIGATVSANAGFFNVRAINVQDLATNPIVNNGTTNVGSFFIQNLAFEGDVRLRLCKGEFAPTDTFAVEGSVAPLTFSIADNARMYDANADSVYTVTVPFCMPKNSGTGKAEADLLWKLSHTPSGDAFEPGANRTVHLSSDSGSVQTVRASWANDNPADYTTRAVDVIFRINAAPLNPAPGDTLELRGNQAPLAFGAGIYLLKDNGVAPDAVAGDKIYAVRVTFPTCSYKNVEWKVFLHPTQSYECLTQGNRSVYLNSDLFSSANPIVLPARAIDRCTTTDKPVCVTFKVSMFGTPTASGDTIAVIGSELPLSPDRPPSAVSILKDNGVAPDQQAGDRVFSGTVTFPDSTDFNVTYKYWLSSLITNFGFECEALGDRSFNLDDVNFGGASCITRELELFNTCSVTGVPGVSGIEDGVSFGILRPSYPNPGPRSTIRFDLRRPARVTLAIRDVAGRLVSRLIDRELPAGPHQILWDGIDASGTRVRSGVYFCELSSGGERLSRPLVIAR